VIRGQTDARHPPPNSVIFCVIPWPQASPPLRTWRLCVKPPRARTGGLLAV
jgi:hypothetical protein